MGTTPMDTGRGTFAYYGTLPGTGSSLIVVLLQDNVSFPSDSTLEAATTLAAVLGLANVAESNATNYARVTASSVNVSIASHVTTLTSANFLWSNLGGATNNNLKKAVVAYKPSAGATDSQCIPLGQYDFVLTTDGSSVTATVNASGLMTAA